MNKCVVCNKRISKKKSVFTCSPKCAGYLSASKKLYMNYKKKYSAEDKIKNMSQLIKILSFYDKPNVLELHGGGVFFELLRKEGNCSVLTIDNNKKLFPAIKTILGNTINCIFCPEDLINVLSSKKYIKQIKNINFAYLDYCGTWTQDKLNEISILAKIMSDGSHNTKMIAFSITRNRESFKYESNAFSKTFDDCLTAQIKSVLPEYLTSFHQPSYLNIYRNGNFTFNTYLYLFNSGCLENDKIDDHGGGMAFYDTGIWNKIMKG